ncbi:hypothetical protein KP509_22G061700 [Ceratopteris richardii]|uniref:RING-type domain-containing protein n=1 Tax=Ceratopteris richardii TaxID=49495 RepID=A0A8T2S5R5_CERRI|nr:hypothetical protein KP509_22G061700 [Ceratopteris richardii]
MSSVDSSFSPHDKQSGILSHPFFIFLALSVFCIVAIFTIFYFAVYQFFWNRPAAASRFRLFRTLSAGQGGNVRGLSKSEIACLPKFTFTILPAAYPDTSGTGGEGSLLECAVCLERFNDGDNGRMLPDCRHGFHVHCIDMWLSCNPTCPLCRKQVLSSMKTSPPASKQLPLSVNAEGVGEEDLRSVTVHGPNSVAFCAACYSNVAEIQRCGSISATSDEFLHISLPRVEKPSCFSSSSQERTICIPHVTIELSRTEDQTESLGRPCISLRSQECPPFLGQDCAANSLVSSSRLDATKTKYIQQND